MVKEIEFSQDQCSPEAVRSWPDEHQCMFHVAQSPEERVRRRTQPYKDFKANTQCGCSAAY